MTEGARNSGPECSGAAATIVGDLGDGTDNNNNNSGGVGVILGNFSMGHANVSAVFSGEEYKYPLLLVIYSATFALGFAGNSVALWDFLWHRRYRSPSCMCLINLAFADLLFVLSLPIRLFYYSRAADVELPATLCRVSHYAFYVNMYGSIYLLACYSVMRYLAVARPMRAKALITMRRAALACAAIWIFVLSSSAPLLVKRSSEQGTKCFDLQKGSVSFLYKMNAFAAAVGCAMPFAVILLCYAGIWRSLAGGPETSASPVPSSSSLPAMLRLRASGGVRAARRRRAAHLMLAVVLVFVVCFIPYHVLRTVYLHLRLWRGGDWVAVHKGLLAAAALTALNCVLDPLLYYFSGEIFRRRALAMWDSAVRLQSTRMVSGGAAGGTGAVVLHTNSNKNSSSNNNNNSSSNNNRGTASPGRAPSRVEKVATLDCPV
ncbi:cysteinyl leukotriene receptor 2-like isoform X2 [Petromyzon marinus]